MTEINRHTYLEGSLKKYLLQLKIRSNVIKLRLMCYYCVYISDALIPIERLTVLCNGIASERTMRRAKNDKHEDETIDPAAQARFPVMVSVYIPAFLILK